MMTWSYSGNPGNSSLDAVRFYIGDTDETDQLLVDSEINFILESETNPMKAASTACDIILVRLSREVDYTIGPESVKASQKLDNYLKVKAALEKRIADSQTKTYIPSPSWRDPLSAEPPTIFAVGMHDNDEDWVDLDG